MPPKTNEYINVSGQHESPSRSQEKGALEFMSRGYAITENPNINDRTSSILGVPFIQGGADISALDPKAWHGAESITLLSTIDTGNINSKIGSSVLSVKGASIIESLVQQIFTGDADDSDYNYAYNIGDLTVFGAGNYILPEVGDALKVSASGDGAIVLGSESSCALNKTWARSLWVSPSDLLAGFFWGKGYGDASTCQAGIGSDGTNIYRVIGGIVKNVGLVSTYLSTSEHTLLTLINLTDSQNSWDAFGINDSIVSAPATTSRGVFTSTLPETIGGIFTTNDDTSALTANANGHYRLLNRHGDDFWYVKETLGEWVNGMYVNYTSSILLTVDGDSIANGANGDSTDRNAGFAFRIKDIITALGYDVLVACTGTSGSAFEQKCPSDFPFPSDRQEEITYNSLSGNALRWCRDWRTDLLITNSGTNELPSITEDHQPNKWNQLTKALMMMSKCCSQYGVPFYHNTCGVTDRNTPGVMIFRRALAENIRDQISMRSPHSGDWSRYFTNLSTGDVHPQLMTDAAHPNKFGHRFIAGIFIPFIAGHVYSSRILYPETTP